jgi:phage FluMu protein Com
MIHMSRIIRCPYPGCNNEFNFKHVGKLFRMSEGDRRYIVIRCPKCKGILKYRRGEVY